MRNAELSRLSIPAKAFLALACVLAPHSALHTPNLFAHPVPRAEYDRNLTVTWRIDSVQILYRLEIDEFTLLTLVGNPANEFPLKKERFGRKDLADAFIVRMREVIPDGVVVTIDGKPMAVTCTDGKVNFTDSAQFQFRLKADFAMPPGQHRLEVEDLNFPGKKGRLAMKFDASSTFKVEKITEPPEGRLTETTDVERRTLGATVSLAGAAPTVDEAANPVEPVPGPTSAPEGFWQLLHKVQDEENLAILLDTDAGLWLILLLAFAHGVLHSISPGHGKTMVAAYLVGEQGTPKHAIILGLIVTLTHTSAAFAVALLLKFALRDTTPQTVQSILGIGGGVLVVVIGLWLFMQRLAGRSDHVHAFAGHAHSHAQGDDHGHAHSHVLSPAQFGRVSWLRLILLGISGGIIPCWGAILWVLYCVTAARYGLAVWAVLAFSVGLAGVLILIGLSVVWGGRVGGRTFGGKRWFRYVTHWLPIVGAALVVAIGLWLVRVNLPR